MQSSQDEQPSGKRTVNVGHGERMASIAVGSGLLALGLPRRSRLGWSLAVTGAALLYRGLRGYCAAFHALGIDRATDAQGRRGNLGVKVERVVSMEESAEKIYGFWRDFRNLPLIMPNLESVTVQSDTQSHWVVKGPMGARFEWDAKIINDKPHELIAWRTEGSRVEHAGSVHFEATPDGGTLVRVALQYHPPGGELTHMVAALFGEDPGIRIEEDLTRLKDALGHAHEDRDVQQSATIDALAGRSPTIRQIPVASRQQ
jgi:uncharacterized membrane protein